MSLFGATEWSIRANANTSVWSAVEICVAKGTRKRDFGGGVGCIAVRFECKIIMKYAQQLHLVSAFSSTIPTLSLALSPRVCVSVSVYVDN